MDEKPYGVLTDTAWARLELLIEAVRPRGKAEPLASRIRRDGGARWKRSFGGTTTAPNGGQSRPNSALGGWLRNAGTAGSTLACGSAYYRWRRSVAAGLRWAWRSWTVATSARTAARPARPKRGRGTHGPTSAERDAREALGRSRGGFGTKAVALADSHGRAVAFVLAPGQAHEAPLAPTLLDALPDGPGWVVADKGYSSDAIRERVWDMGARPAIPAKSGEPLGSTSNEAAVRCPDWIYKHRNEVERLWGRLKEWRAIATRYEKCARSFMGVLCLAATMNWIKP